MAGGGGAVLSPASVASRRAGEPHARRLTAVLQKYHVNEVRSLRFGTAARPALIGRPQVRPRTPPPPYS